MHVGINHIRIGGQSRHQRPTSFRTSDGEEAVRASSPGMSEGRVYGRLTLVLSPELVMTKVPAVATGVYA